MKGNVKGKQDSSHWKDSCTRGPGTVEVKKEEGKLQVFVRTLGPLPNLVQPHTCLSPSKRIEVYLVQKLEQRLQTKDTQSIREEGERLAFKKKTNKGKPKSSSCMIQGNCQSQTGNSRNRSKTLSFITKQVGVRKSSYKIQGRGICEQEVKKGSFLKLL